MASIKSFLKRWPLLYHLLQRVYYGFRRIIETHVLGTRMQEWIWQNRHSYKGDDWAKGYSKSAVHPHRQLLLEKIMAYAPLESVLEIGCNTGPNLYLLAKQLPEANLYGIDINHMAIEVGKEWLEQAGVENIQLSAGKADKLGRFTDKSIDLIFTDATIIYIGPDKIQKVLREMKRIARKAIIFNEWHQENRIKECFYYDAHWVYNYRSIFGNCVLSPNSIVVTKIPKDLWGGSGWEEFGAIIEVSL